MTEDRSAALLDTDAQPALTSKAPVAQRGGLRRCAVIALCAVCLAVLTGLVLVYALMSLPEGLSLLIGVTIVLVGAAMITGIGVMRQAPSEWE